jgi:Fe-S-cluster containining protein
MISDAARTPWLPVLERMHALVDAGVAKAVRERERRGRQRRACAKGCAVCCRTQSDIPALQIELAGISWYCAERLEGAVRAAVRDQLGRHAPGNRACPFLVDAACAVHPVRPIACRLFTVFGERCAEGEDPFHARRADLLAPPPGLLANAYRVMLPFHGVTDPADQQAWLERDLVRSLVVNLPTCDWRTLVRVMDRVEGSAERQDPDDGNERLG